MGYLGSGVRAYLLVTRSANAQAASIEEARSVGRSAWRLRADSAADSLLKKPTCWQRFFGVEDSLKFCANF